MTETLSLSFTHCINSILSKLLLSCSELIVFDMTLLLASSGWTQRFLDGLTDGLMVDGAFAGTNEVGTKLHRDIWQRRLE